MTATHNPNQNPTNPNSNPVNPLPTHPVDPQHSGSGHDKGTTQVPNTPKT